MAEEISPQELATKIQEWIEGMRAAETGTYSEAAPEVVEAEYLEDVDRDTYHDAMEMVFDEYGVPEEMREQVYEQLDAEGAYNPAGYIENLTIVVEDNDITNHIDNSVEVGDGASIHGGITQQNETNVSTADGEGAIAGRDQDGQFQTGDGVQVGDENSGVVNQGDNSGQQAGNDATADDITSGDGNLVNDGSLSENAIAFGGGDATNQADDVDDYSTNDSFNTNDSYNDEYSGNTSDSFNHTASEDVSHTVDATIDATATDSFNEDNDWKDVDDSHNETVDADDMAYE